MGGRYLFRIGERVFIEAFGVRLTGRIAASGPAKSPAPPLGCEGWAWVEFDHGELSRADPERLQPVKPIAPPLRKANLGTPSRRERARFVALLIAKAKADHRGDTPMRTGRELLDKLAVDFRRPHIARAASLYALMREKLAGGEKLRPDDWLF